MVGAGPNGPVATCLLADAGWDVCVLEANDRIGGAVASVERIPGYVSDLYSAFYPLAYASPAIASLELEGHGLPEPLSRPGRRLARVQDVRGAGGHARA